jgi:hypothetical protein
LAKDYFEENNVAENNHWSKPQAMAIPKEGYFKLEQGRYGAVYRQTPACYGFSVVAKVKPGREQAMRDYGKNIEEQTARTAAENVAQLTDPGQG